MDKNTVETGVSAFLCVCCKGVSRVHWAVLEKVAIFFAK